MRVVDRFHAINSEWFWSAQAHTYTKGAWASGNKQTCSLKIQ